MTTSSLSGSTIPIIDSVGNSWTVVAGVVQMNGTNAGTSGSVTILLYYNSIIYQFSTVPTYGGWYGWINNAWVLQTGDPRGTTTTPPVITPPPVTTGLLGYLQSLAGQTKHILTGQHSNYWDGNPMDCVTPIPGVAGGKQVAILGTSNFWLNSDGVSSNWNPALCISLTNAWLAQGGIVQVTQGCPVNAGWLSGAAVTDIYKPGTTANNKWNIYLQTNVIDVFNSFTGPCLFRAFPECNNNWGISSLLTPAEYILMWQYTYNYCQSKSIKNVLWEWNVNDWDHMNNGNTYYSGSEWYPGNTYVDVVSFDAYPPGQGGWDTTVYDFLVSTGKPTMLGEFGYNGSLNSGDIAPILQTVKTKFPKIIAMPCWCQSAAIYLMPDANTFMSDPAVINLSDLPKGI